MQVKKNCSVKPKSPISPASADVSSPCGTAVGVLSDSKPPNAIPATVASGSASNVSGTAARMPMRIASVAACLDADEPHQPIGLGVATGTGHDRLHAEGDE